MIVFNGIALESVANVKIEDIRVSPIKYNPVARPRAIRGGSDFVRMRDGERTVTITFALQDMNMANRHLSLMAVSKWALTDKEYWLELPTEPNKSLKCVCTAKPEPSTRQWWEAKLRLVFTCFDNPYWTSRSEKAVACGTAFTVLGDAPPLMRIEHTVTSAISNQVYYRDGETDVLYFSTIPVGNMVIDLNNQTAAVGSSSIMQYVSPASVFVSPKTGTQTIIGVGTVKYRERYE